MHNMTSTLNTKTVILLFATLLTGLLAGVFFTWTNAITPGIGRLSDVGYLQAFQHMNRTILNPIFFIVFMGPVILTFASYYNYKADTKTIARMLLGVAVIYFLGVFMVTLLGNLPLNDMLDKTNLDTITATEAKILRASFENKWNSLHLIRTISSATAFTFLILSCLLKKEDETTINQLNLN
jgi:uncharacterized membrane protein